MKAPEMIAAIRTRLANLSHRGEGSHCGCYTSIVNRWAFNVLKACGEWESVKLDLDKDDRSDEGYTRHMRRVQTDAYGEIEQAFRILGL